MRVLVSCCVIVALVLPAAVPAQAASAGQPLAQEEELEQAAPTPEPLPVWPEVSALPQYTPSFDPLPEPASQSLEAAIHAAAAEEATAVDAEAGKLGVLAGTAAAVLTPAGGEVHLGGLQIALRSEPGAVTQPVAVAAEVLPSEQASEWSPVGMAFRLSFATPSADGVQASATLAAHQPVSLTLDYSQIPLRYGGSFGDRLTLYRVTDCAPDRYAADELAGVDGVAQAAAGEPCRTWTALPGEHDPTSRRLTVALAPQEKAAEGRGDAPAEEQDDGLSSKLDQRLFLPLVADGPAAPAPVGEVLYVLAAAASSQQGTYTATPFANVSDYQVALYTGAMQTSYPIPVPPAAGGVAPALALEYDSSSLDGMTTTKNNQPGWVGIGWNLQSGYITRHLKTCYLTQAPGDLCLTGEEFSIVLNGVSSRLVLEGGNVYRLQRDPHWKVVKYTDGGSQHPDAQKEYWWVITPDGMRYRFGGEIDPESGADQDSAFYATVYSTGSLYCGNFLYDLCNKVYQWNLDRVEDTNGNVTKYFYDQETNYYAARNDQRADFRKLYVRAGYLNRIEYGHRLGVNATPPTRVRFVTENRCDAPCTWPTHYYDTPGDLECTVTPSTCSQNAQTFWSKQRLDYVETQYYDPGASAWVSVARYDLAYSFPTPPTDPQGDTSERKLWLASITQRLADGSGGLPAVSYDYTMLANRASFSAAGISPLYMPRINQIETELGGVVSFTYGQSHACNTGSSNHVRRTDDCFYHWFVNGGSSGWVLWNRWKVLQMSQSDSFSANPTQTYTYTYSSPVSHYSNDPALPDWTGSCPSLLSTCAKRTWNDFRGSEIVTVTDSSGAQTEYRFHRGMNGDRNTTSGGTYSASITLSDSSTRSDENWLSGQIVEVRRLTSGSVAKQRTAHWFTAALTAGSGIWGAYFVGVQKQEQTVTDTTSKTTRTEYVYDSYGNVTQEILHGDTVTTADDRLVERGYLYNTSAHIVDRPLWEKLWAGTTPGGSGGAITTTCTTYPSSDVPKTIPSSGTPTIYSDLTISTTGTISDVDVLGLNGTHTWINDLDFSLTSPAATTVVIMARSCSSQDNFNLNLDDEAAPGAWPCPPVGGGTYRPSNPLSAFDGQDPNGTWRLTVKDYVTNDGGSLNGWGLRLCTNTEGPPAPTGNEKAFTVYAYDNGAVGDAPTQGNPTLVRRYSQVTPSAAYVDTTTSYDSYGRPLSVTDANNHTTTTAYHSFYGSVISTTNPLNQVTSYVHDPGWGVVTQVTDPNNHITELAYDGYGRLEQVWLPSEDKASDPASLAFVYDAAARPAQVKTRTLQVKGSSTYLESWQYVDGFGRGIQTQTPTATGGNHIVTSQQYDNLGQLRYQSAPYQLSGAAGSGYSSPTWNTVANYHQFYYDELGRQTKDETRSQSSVLWDVETTYDAWTQQRYDANNHRRDHAYNAFGQLVQVKEYYATNSFYTTGYTYDLLGDLTQVTDHLSNVTSMSYDLLGRKSAMTDCI